MKRTARDLVPRRGVLASVGLGITTLALPSASAAASNLGIQALDCAEPTFTPIPFIAEDSSRTVGSVTITATLNTAIDSGPTYAANGYLHAGPKLGRPGEFDAGATTTLTFGPGLSTLRVTTAYHADGSNAGIDEVYTLTGRTTDGAELFVEQIVDENTTLTLPAFGEFSAGLAELEIVYSAINGTPDYQYASIIYLEMLTC